MGRLVRIVGLAGALLVSHVAGAAAAVVLDPLCVQSCRDDNCGSAPQDQFATCTDGCTSKFTTCPSLSYCFVKCDKRRASLAAQCQGARQACIRNHCRILIGRARPVPAAVASPCQQRCRAALPVCRTAIGKANRHCKAKCRDECGGFPFPQAVQACLGVCSYKYDAGPACPGKYDQCLATCGSGS
jgi:hypothetical protein